MRQPALFFVAFCVALIVAAVGWWNTRGTTVPAAAVPPRAAAIQPITSEPTSPVPHTATPSTVADSGDTPSTAGIDDIAARFAAQPALIDALEDAAPENDARVRSDAEQLLRQLVPPEPTPTTTPTP